MATESLIVELDAQTSSLDRKLVKTSDNLDDVAVSAKNADNALDGVSSTGLRVSRTATAVNSSLSSVGRSAGQAGIQIQQFVGQVQGGQNALLALSQQSADLGFVLGAPLAGAIVGIGASIAGFLLPEILKTNEALKDFSFNVNEVANSAEKLGDLTRRQVAAAIIETNKSLDELSEGAGDVGERIAALNSRLDEGTKQVVTYTRGGNALVEVVKLTDAEIKDLNEDLAQENANLDSINQQYAKQVELLKDLTAATNGIRQDAPFSELFDIGRTEASAAAIASIIEGTYEQFQQAPSPFSNLFDIGQTEADAQLFSDIIDERNSQLIQAQELFVQRVNELGLTTPETIEEQLAREVEINRLALEQRLIDEEEFRNRQAELTERYSADQIKQAQARTKAEQSIERNNASTLLNIAQSLASGNDEISKALFLTSQALSASEVFFNTQAAAVRALAELGPIAGPPVAAQIETSGAIRIAAIAAQTFGSLAGGSSSSGGTISANTATNATETASDFTPETSTLELTEQSDTGSQVITIKVPDGDEIGEAIANWLNKATIEGRV